MAAAKQIQGLNIMVYLGTTALGGQKNCTLSMEADTIDVSNKNDFGWSSFIAGAKSWTVSCDGQFLTNDEGQAALIEAFRNSSEVEIEMRDADSTIYYGGTAVITSLELEASYDDVFAYSVEFQGKGALNNAKGE